MIRQYMEMLNIDTDYYDPDRISEQYREWYDTVTEKTGLDPAELYRMANQTEGEVMVHYLATRGGCGFGFWDQTSWQFHDTLYHAAIKQGRLE